MKRNQLTTLPMVLGMAVFSGAMLRAVSADGQAAAAGAGVRRREWNAAPTWSR